MTAIRSDFGLARRLAAEGLGTALLLSIVVGSGIMGERLSGGNDAIALMLNTVSTGAGLAVLITLLGPISGAHFNPLVSALAACDRDLGAGEALVRGAVQVVAGIAGVLLAHAMFELPLFQVSDKVRSGGAQVLSEGIATFGLILVIRLASRLAPGATAALVALYITAAYGFTASTAFANPAVTLARSLTDTFAGIAPQSVPGFLLGQGLGAVAARAVSSGLLGSRVAPPRS